MSISRSISSTLDDGPIRGAWQGDGMLQDPMKELAAMPRGPAIEPEGEFIEVAG